MGRNFGDLIKGREELDLTSGSIREPLFHLSVPIVVSMMLQVAYNLADTFWLGQYSTESLAALTFSFMVVFVFISLGAGVTVAGNVLVAQYTGGEEHERAREAAAQLLIFAVAIAGVLGIVGYLFGGAFIDRLGARPDVLALATAYIKLVSLGLPLYYVYSAFTSVMRGIGDTITPMKITFWTVVLNVVLDPLLIFGVWGLPELGITGAAYATIVSRGVAMVVGLAILFRGRRGIHVRVPNLSPNPTYLTRIVGIGGPAAVERTSRSVQSLIILAIVAIFPTSTVAGFGVGARLYSIIFLPAVAVALGVETMTAQNIGAGNVRRAARTNHTAARSMFLLFAAVGLGVILTADVLVGLFSADPAVIREGAEFLRYAAPGFAFIGVMWAYNGGFRGTGKTAIAAVVTILTLWIVRIPFAWFAAQLYGATGIWIAYTVSNAIGGTAAYLWFKRGSWRKVDSQTEPGGAEVDR